MELVGYALVLCLLRRWCSRARQPTIPIRFLESVYAEGLQEIAGFLLANGT
jgi:hypothetical protein